MGWQLEEGAESRRGSSSLSFLRMGANHSKERPQEGVLSQMKNLLKSSNNRPTVPAAGTGVSTLRSNSSAPPSPRTLADTLSSPQLRENFLQFLKHLDTNAGTPPNHCGRAGSLKFVLAMKQIAQSKEGNRPEEWIQFFPTDNTGLVLNNDPNLWRRCAEATKKVELSDEDLQALHLARDHCLKQLAREHEQFLVQRANEKATAMSKLTSCCVLL